MIKYYYVIKCTQRGLDDEELTCISHHREYYTAEDERDDLNSNWDKPNYVHYFVSQYRSGKD